MSIPGIVLSIVGFVVLHKPQGKHPGLGFALFIGGIALGYGVPIVAFLVT